MSSHSEDVKVVREVLDALMEVAGGDLLKDCKNALAALSRIESAIEKPSAEPACLTDEERDGLENLNRNLEEEKASLPYGISKRLWINMGIAALNSLLSRASCPHAEKVTALEKELAEARAEIELLRWKMRWRLVAT